MRIAGNEDKDVKPMLDNEGLWLVADVTNPGAMIIVSSRKGRLTAWSADNELDPTRFLETMVAIGPFTSKDVILHDFEDEVCRKCGVNIDGVQRDCLEASSSKAADLGKPEAALWTEADDHYADSDGRPYLRALCEGKHLFTGPEGSVRAAIKFHNASLGKPEAEKASEDGE